MTHSKDTRLLVITNRFPHFKDSISSSFVKDQVDCLRNYFGKVCVISLIPVVPKFLSKSSLMNPRWKRDAFASNYKYDNVDVYFAKYFALPINFIRKMKGDIAFKVVADIIKEKKIEFDLVHAHFTYPAGYVAAKLKEIHKKPVLLTVHENRDFFLKEVSSTNKEFLYCWRNVNKIIRVNKRDLEIFEKIGIDKSKLLSIPNGFSAEFKIENIDIARKKLGLSVSDKIILTIGILEEYKGQKYLIEAMEKIIIKRKDIFLFIIGQGSLKNDLQSKIKKYGIEKNIILAGGNKPRNEIVQWMNACNVFVLPSLSESFGIVQIEAMSCGKPVIATFNGGSEEIIIDKNLGILVQPKDVEGLANAILEALNKEWDKEYIQNYAKYYSWDNITKNLIIIYKDCLEKQ